MSSDYTYSSSPSSSSTGVRNLFIYSTDAASLNVRNRFNSRGFTLVALTKDPKTFWNNLKLMTTSGILVLLSHGDTSGPLLVSGTSGEDLTETEISNIIAVLKEKSISFYCLSCHTGGDGAFNKLLSSAEGVKYVAPIGYASVGASSEHMKIESVKEESGNVAAGWSGSLAPKTGNSLSIPFLSSGTQPTRSSPRFQINSDEKGNK
jgi:hypothetical protein